MATGQYFSISKKTARGYRIPAGRPITANPAGVTAIMGLSNGNPRRRRRRVKRDALGRFIPKKSLKCNKKVGGITCHIKPPAKYRSIGATKPSDYAYPQCFAYPLKARTKKDTYDLVEAATRLYRMHSWRYSPQVKSVLKKRITAAARKLGISTSGLEGRKTKRNEGESPMIVMENKRRRSRKHKAKKGLHSKRTRKSTHGRKALRTLLGRSFSIRPAKKRMLSATARRNAEEYMEEMFENGDLGDDMFENRRKRARKAGKGKKRRTAAQRAATKKSVALNKKRGGKKGRKHAKRSTRKAARRPAARRTHKTTRRTTHKRRSTARGRGLTISRSKRGLSVLLRNAAEEIFGNPAPAGMRAARARSIAQARALEARRAAAYRRQISDLRELMTRGAARGGVQPWHARAYARMSVPRVTHKKRGFNAADVLAAAKGATPTSLLRAMEYLASRTRQTTFSSPLQFHAAMKGMAMDPVFRTWFRREAAALGMSGGTRRKSRKAGRKGRKHARKAARRSCKSRRRHTRRGGLSGFARELRLLSFPNRARRNMAYPSLGQALASVGIGIAAWAVPAMAVSKLASKGTLTPKVANGLQAAVGALAFLFSDKIFKTNDAYAKAMSIGGAVTAAQGIYNLIKSFSATSGFGLTPASRGTTRYVLNQFGQPMLQAAAGPFLQAQAGYGQPFLQAQAGYGEYFTGTGEYVSANNTVAPVSDFGEYVASNLAVQGWGDYEVSKQFIGGSDGYGLVNDGVRPDANMDHELNIMEAAAGLGGSPTVRSDYIPTVSSTNVGTVESPADTGIFDVGGNNGVFG